MKLFKSFNKASLPRFKKSLFCEGLRQLKIGGIAYVVITTIATLLSTGQNVTFGDYIVTHNMGRLRYYLDDIPFGIFAIASAFAVLAVFYISNFMRSAKARDFYCATPHSHGMLWLNFAASALAWTAAGVLAYFLVTAVLLMPLDPKVFGALFFIACNIFAAAFMVFGMAVLAVTLTGRLIPALLTLAGLSALSTCMKYAYAEGRHAIYSKFSLVTETSDLELYDPVYFIFRRMFFGGFSYTGDYFSSDAFSLFNSWRTIGYGLLMGFVMLAVAAVFGTIRTGDAVGKPFVNEAAHVISLTSATLPVGFVITYCFFRVTEEWLHDPYFSLAPLFTDDDWLVVILLVLFIVGAFWGAELLLTFDIKHAHRAFKYFPVPVVATMAALLVGFFGMKAEFNTVPTADEVESFTLVRNDVLPDELAFFRMSETFGRAVTNETEFTDKETIAYVTGKMKQLSDEYGHDTQKAYDAHAIWENEKTGIINIHEDGKGNNLITIRLNLKNGKHLYRTVAFDQKHITGLESAMLNDSDFMKKFLALPAADIINLDITDHMGMTRGEAVAIYKSFVKEYNALSDAEKLDYIKTSVMNHYVNDAYDEEAYDDEYDDEYDDNKTTVVHEVDDETTVAYETVSRTDIHLVSKSKKTGDFGIVETYYNEQRYDGSISIAVSGYPENRLYDEEQFFIQDFELDNKRFPKTIALTVKTCNSKFSGIRDRIKKVQSGDDYRFCDIDADYYSNGNSLTVLYRYISGKNSENAELSVKGEYYGSYSDDEDVIYKDFEVDSNEMIERLFNDTAATETVDFTKPFCKFTWNNYDSYKNGLPGNMTFYAQTENPVDYLHLLADEQPQTETKGKKK